LLDRHQDRLAADEDLIGRDLAGAGATARVEDAQGGAGPAAGVAGPPAQAGPRRGGRAEDDGEQALGGGQAGAEGLGGGDELGLLGGVQDDGAGQAAPGLVEVRLEVGEALAEVLELAAVVDAFDGTGGGVGLAVDGLPANATLGGEGGDVAVVAEEDGGGAGEGVGGG
jgi:hypothetical protein